jgi:hypothetical protein
VKPQGLNKKTASALFCKDNNAEAFYLYNIILLLNSTLENFLLAKVSTLSKYAYSRIKKDSYITIMIKYASIYFHKFLLLNSTLENFLLAKVSTLSKYTCNMIKTLELCPKLCQSFGTAKMCGRRQILL